MYLCFFLLQNAVDISRAAAFPLSFCLHEGWEAHYSITGSPWQHLHRERGGISGDRGSLNNHHRPLSSLPNPTLSNSRISIKTRFKDWWGAGIEAIVHSTLHKVEEKSIVYIKEWKGEAEEAEKPLALITFALPLKPIPHANYLGIRHVRHGAILGQWHKLNFSALLIKTDELLNPKAV